MHSDFPDKLRYTNRWFCYFDLLGFSSLVKRSDIDRVLPLYEKALGELEKGSKEKRKYGISISWFSDTFIIFTNYGRAEDFPRIEQTCRLFFQFLVLNHIPARGALTFGELYTQQERNVFIGPALIDAYRYGEGQNWIGFVLTPAAIAQMESEGLQANKRLTYREVLNSNILKPSVNGPVYAFAYNNGKVNGQNPYLKAIEEMKAKVSNKHHDKYDRTIEFIKKHDH